MSFVPEAKTYSIVTLVPMVLHAARLHLISLG